MHLPDKRTTLRRISALLLAGFALWFGGSWKGAPCPGDRLLAALGLPAWSVGPGEGLHLPVLLSLVLLAVASRIWPPSPNGRGVQLWVPALILLVLLGMLLPA
ncbi:MAG: hypothetical protein DBX44_03820 [Oscillospiraceae bacterium]|nr:MAG: hypothetical protein DBX44_03820 [Oscillospiraceae bacterium]